MRDWRFADPGCTLEVWSPFRVRCAGPIREEADVMSNMDERRLFGRRRRANAPADNRREKRYEVTANRDERLQLEARAAVMQVSVPRLLIESALTPNVRTDTEWKTVAADIFEIRRLMGTVANNVNQLARFANEEGVFPAEAESVVAEYRSLVRRLDNAVRALAGL